MWTSSSPILMLFIKRSQSKRGVGRTGDGSGRSAGETTRRVKKGDRFGRDPLSDGKFSRVIRILKPHEMYIVWKRSL
jgi:hypothetical protein